MSEPLVTRNDAIQGGRPCLRGTRFPVSQLQDALAHGGIEYVRQQYSALDDWTAEHLAEAATYPSLLPSLNIGTMDALEWCIDIDTDGSFQVNGWYRFEAVPALVIAIHDASHRITDWLDECRTWEEVHR